MAVLVGLAVGFLNAYPRGRYRFAVALLVPLVAAAVEIAVNTARFGVVAMIPWTVILLVATVGATAAAGRSGQWLAARHRAS